MSSNIVNLPYFPIPPPPAHVVQPPPPPPHVVPPPPPPSPDHGPTIIIIVFISLGCILFLSLCLLALWCFLTKRKTTKATQETDVIRTEEHLKIKEAIVEGPHGQQSVVLSIEDDKHFEEEIIKTEKFQGKKMAAKSRELAYDIEGGESSSSSSVVHNHQSLEQKH